MEFRQFRWNPTPLFLTSIGKMVATILGITSRTTYKVTLRCVGGLVTGGNAIPHSQAFSVWDLYRRAITGYSRTSSPRSCTRTIAVLVVRAVILASYWWCLALLSLLFKELKQWLHNRSHFNSSMDELSFGLSFVGPRGRLWKLLFHTKISDCKLLICQHVGSYGLCLDIRFTSLPDPRRS